MSVAAIICEYNPFHFGHAYQMERIKSELGPDTVILSLMSGSVVQRGEVAIASKYNRAAAAVTMGADLVLELPYPYCGSVAEHFATAAVSILNDLGCVDYLVFGSETGSIKALQKHVSRRFCDEFSSTLETLRKEKKTLSYPCLVDLCYQTLYGEPFLHSPNDILGIYYLKALLDLGSSIVPLTHLRLQGACATLARSDMKKGDLSRVPPQIHAFFSENNACLENGQRAILYSLRKSEEKELSKAASSALSLSDFYSQIGDKNSTDANLRRRMLGALLGYSEADFTLPCFTNVLAMNEKGAQLLHGCKKTSKIPIVTKPADYRKFGQIRDAFEMNLRADGLFAICSDTVLPDIWSLFATPFVKK